MEPPIAFELYILAITAASLLGLIITTLFSYWVIRLAVTHALRTHHHQTNNNH